MYKQGVIENGVDLIISVIYMLAQSYGASKWRRTLDWGC
jgi:hypothetical protein